MDMPTLLPSSALPMARERFAEHVGLPIGVITGWCDKCDKGHIPCISVGKYSLINVALFYKQCLERELA